MSNSSGALNNKLKCAPLLLLLIFLNCFYTTTTTPLKQLHIIFRHGDRTPTETYKNDPYINYTWPDGWGHLTNRGKFELYSLGLMLRQVYSDFIPEYYYAEDVKVLSSYSDRCLMSAQTLLAGLFPPKDQQIWNQNILWQPIPVTYTPRNKDNLVAMKAKCDRYDKELKEVMKSPAIEEINRNNSELYQFLTEKTGQLYNDIHAVEFLYNTLEIELLHNLTLPAWTSGISFHYLKELAARSLATFTETDFMKKMKGGVFLKHVITSMEKELPILHLYAAHDITLVNILRTLGHKAVLKPGFGASLAFELQQNSQISMFYRNDFKSPPEEINIENCDSTCNFEKYKNELQVFLPADWDEECKF